MSKEYSEPAEKLKELGFNEPEVSDAIKASGGDLDRAIRLLTTDGNQEFEHQAAHQISGVYEDNFVMNSQHPRIDESMQNQPSLKYSKLPYTDSDHSSMEASHTEHIEPLHGYQDNEDTDEFDDMELSDYAGPEQPTNYGISIFDLPQKFKRQRSPIILCPVNPQFLESYFVHLICIFHEIPGLRNVLMQNTFSNYGYKAGWWNDTVIPIENEEVTKDDYNVRFIMEVQRLFAFLDGVHSQRAFASTKSYVRSIPASILDDLERDKVQDSISAFNEEIVKQSKIIGSADLISKFFESKTSNEDEPTVAFSLDTENIKSNINEIFNELFWSDDFSSLGETYFESLSEVITISMQDFPPPNLNSNFVLNEVFYPQIYSKKFVPIIKKMIETRIRLIKQSHEYSKLNTSLTAFQGKRVGNFISSALQYLESKLVENDQESENMKLIETVEDLSSLSDSIKNRKLEITSSAELLKSEAEKLDVSDADNILDFIKQLPGGPAYTESKIMSDETEKFDSESMDNIELSKTFSNDDTNNTETKPNEKANTVELQFSDYSSIFEEAYYLVGLIINEFELYYRLSQSHHDFPGLWVHAVFNGSKGQPNTESVPFDQIRSVLAQHLRSISSDTAVLIYAKQSQLSVESNFELPEPLRKFLDADNEELENSIEEWQRKELANEENERKEWEKKKREEKEKIGQMEGGKISMGNEVNKESSTAEQSRWDVSSVTSSKENIGAYNESALVVDTKSEEESHNLDEIEHKKEISEDQIEKHDIK